MFSNNGKNNSGQVNSNHGSVVSTNLPLPENAPQYNRNALGMDVGVNRIDGMTIDKYKNELTASILNDTQDDFMDFTEPAAAALDNVFLIQHLKDFDHEWHQKSFDYVDNLSIKDKFILRAYTRHGDRLINKLIRDPDNFDTDSECKYILLKQIKNNGNNVIAVQIFEELGLDPEKYLVMSGKIRPIPAINAAGIGELIEYSRTINLQQLDKIKEHIMKLSQEIKRIINAAPRITRKIRLFRGIKYDYVSSNNANSENVFDLRGFQSMSYSIISALSFSGQYNDNNLQKHPMLYSIILHPGTACIALDKISYFGGGNENEILVNMDLQCRFKNEFSEKIHMVPEIYHYSQILDKAIPHPTISTYVKELIIAPQLTSRRARANESINSNSNSNAESESNNNSNRSLTNSVLNAAFYHLGFNGHGGFVNVGKKLKKTRSNNRMINTQAKTRKNSRTFANMNASKQNASKQKEINEVLKRIKESQAEDTDYAKVRDRDFGFVIVGPAGAVNNKTK
jgi:hypothetical protein